MSPTSPSPHVLDRTLLLVGRPTPVLARAVVLAWLTSAVLVGCEGSATSSGAAAQAESMRGSAHVGSSNVSDDSGKSHNDAGTASAPTPNENHDASIPTEAPPPDTTPPVDDLPSPDPSGLPSASTRDVTFFMTSDTHLGRPDTDAEKASMAMIDAMHQTEGASYPTGLGLTKVSRPLGVVITGDLTEDNRNEQWTLFDSIWGENGQGAVRYPVFEGWGNHDLHGERTAVRLGIVQRHERRKHKVRVSPGDGGHYAWDFHDVHLVHLNLYPGDQGGLSLDSPDLYKPRGSLPFLIEDLRSQVGTSGRPVVIFFHFGFDEGGLRGWSLGERDEFLKAIASYHVIGVFVGHSHAQKFASVESVTVKGRTFDMYMADDTLSAGSGRKTGFYVVHIGPSELVVAERTLNSTAPWGFVRKTALKQLP